MQTDTIDEVYTRQTFCQHPHPTAYQTGWVAFINGEVVDTVTDHICCPDCGADLTTAKSDEGFPF